MQINLVPETLDYLEVLMNMWPWRKRITEFGLKTDKKKCALHKWPSAILQIIIGFRMDCFRIQQGMEMCFFVYKERLIHFKHSALKSFHSTAKSSTFLWLCTSLFLSNFRYLSPHSHLLFEGKPEFCRLGL